MDSFPLGLIFVFYTLDRLLMPFKNLIIEEENNDDRLHLIRINIFHKVLPQLVITNVNIRPFYASCEKC